MKKISICFLMASLMGVFSAPIASADAPPGWKDRPFGKDQHAGSASYQIAGGITNLTVEGGGTDIWGANDYGRFVFTPVAGDCEIIATIPYIATNTTEYGEWLRVGVMMRGSLMHGAQNVAALRVKGPAGVGNRTKLTRRLTVRGDTDNFDSGGDIAYATDSGVRMRLRRQGNTFTAWCSTNAPAYDQWELAGTQVYAYPSAMNLGVCISRWQDLGPDTYTATFNNVVARKLVSATVHGGGISVDWIGDTPLAGGSVVGYSVSRAPLSSAAFTVLSNLVPGASAYSDTTAGYSTSYVYRVYAQVELGAATNDVLVGTSLPARRMLTAGNPSPAPRKGIAAAYYDNNTDYDLVGARVEPYVYDSWNIGGTSVYPAYTGTGLSSMDTFRVRWNGNLVVNESGCYEIVMFGDDIANIYVNDQRLIYHESYQNGNWIYTAPFYLEAGRSHTFQCDVQEDGGGEAMRLNWFKADGTAAEVLMPQAVFEPFPLPWQHKDLGDSPLMGNANFDESDRSFNVTAGIGDLDNLHLIWQRCTTDFDMLASAELSNPDGAGVNAGVTVRSSLERGAQSVAVALVSDGPGGTARSIALTIRANDGGPVSQSTVAAVAESVADLRLSRRGDSLLACYRTSSSGGWVIATNLAVNLPDELCVGMQSFSSSPNLLATNVFSAVTLAVAQAADLNATVAALQATLTTAGNPLLKEQQKALLPNVRWYWHAEVSAVLGGNYTVYKSDHWDNGYSVLADLNAANSYSYTDTLAALNTIFFYKMNYMYDFGLFADSSTNDILYTSVRIGLSDGSIDAGGSGLHASFYRDLDGEFPINLPVHVQLRGLEGWEKGTGGNPMVTAANSDDGQPIGPDKFICSWVGGFVPPYTGYYSFRMQTDDSKVLFLDGKLLIETYGYVGENIYSPDLYLQAGEPLPIHVYFQQGEGGGFFRMWFKHGLGVNAEYVGIPSACLIPLAPQDTEFLFAPGSSNEFGAWRNIDINTARPGHAIVSGTPDLFHCKIVGGGSDIWGGDDGLHYIYQETAENFEMECTVDSMLRPDVWSKLGLMVRESSASNAREISIIQSSKQGRHTQLRPAAGAETVNYDTYNLGLLNNGGTIADTPARFKIVRQRDRVYTYLDDVLIPQNNSDYFDISTWPETVMIGICLTSHNNNRLGEGLVTDVRFKINYAQGSVLILK